MFKSPSSPTGCTAPQYHFLVQGWAPACVRLVTPLVGKGPSVWAWPCNLTLNRVGGDGL